MLGKNIQNQLGAVHNLALGDVGQIAHLRGGQLLVEKNQPRVFLKRTNLKLRQFALAHDGLGIGPAHALHHHPRIVQTSGARQLGKFGQRCLLNRTRGDVHADQQGTLGLAQGRAVGGQGGPPTGQFLFQSLHQRQKIYVHPMPGHGAVDLVGLGVGIGRQQMGVGDLARLP